MYELDLPHPSAWIPEMSVFEDELTEEEIRLQELYEKMMARGYRF